MILRGNEPMTALIYFAEDRESQIIYKTQPKVTGSSKGSSLFPRPADKEVVRSSVPEGDVDHFQASQNWNVRTYIQSTNFLTVGFLFVAHSAPHTVFPRAALLSKSHMATE